MIRDKKLEQLKIYNLLREIEAETDWRTREFHIIKLHYSHLVDNKDNKTLKVFIRMTIPIIYAHWEGFCVTVFRNLLRFFNAEILKYNNVTNNLFTYSQSKTFDYLKGKQSFQQRCKFAEGFLKSILNEAIVFDMNINTKSNLDYGVLKELCLQFGINIDPFMEFESKLNKLVNIRNAIAHGENSFEIKIDKISEYMELVTQMMDKLYIEIYNFLKNKKYLANPEDKVG